MLEVTTLELLEDAMAVELSLHSLNRQYHNSAFVAARSVRVLGLTVAIKCSQHLRLEGVFDLGVGLFFLEQVVSLRFRKRFCPARSQCLQRSRPLLRSGTVEVTLTQQNLRNNSANRLVLKHQAAIHQSPQRQSTITLRSTRKLKDQAKSQLCLRGVYVEHVTL